MTKQELELMDSFGKLEIAVSDLNTLQKAAIGSFANVQANYYKNYIKTITDQLEETKTKFYEILVEHDEG